MKIWERSIEKARRRIPMIVNERAVALWKDKNVFELRESNVFRDDTHIEEWLSKPLCCFPQENHRLARYLSDKMSNEEHKKYRQIDAYIRHKQRSKEYQRKYYAAMTAEDKAVVKIAHKIHARRVRDENLAIQMKINRGKHMKFPTQD